MRPRWQTRLGLGLVTGLPFIYIATVLCALALLVSAATFTPAQTDPDAQVKAIAGEVVGQAADIGITYAAATWGTGGIASIVILLLLGIKKYRKEGVELAATLIKSPTPNEELLNIAGKLGQAGQKKLLAELKKQGIETTG